MDLRIALHTAARRYCIERAPGLNPKGFDRCRRGRYDVEDLRKLDRDRGSPAQLNILGGILFKIESVTPQNFFSVETLRTFLQTLGYSESNRPELPVPFPPGPDMHGVGQSERYLFGAYINALSIPDLNLIAPLPYCHVLPADQASEALSLIRHSWGHLPHFYLEEEVKADVHLEAAHAHVVRLDACDFATHVSLQAVHEILKERGVYMVNELQESDMHLYEMDLDLFVPRSIDDELYWTSSGLEWVMYGSDDGILTLGGEWLIKRVKEIWPGWEKGLDSS